MGEDKKVWMEAPCFTTYLFGQEESKEVGWPHKGQSHEVEDDRNWSGLVL